MPPSARPLRFSVLIPLPDHRGGARAAVPSWVREQTFPRHLYEVIILGDGSDPRLIEQLRPLLAPHDQVRVEPGAHEYQLYDLAAKQARGEVLLITEGHCLARPDFLTEMDRFLATNPEIKAAGCHTEAVASNRFARMDAYWLERGLRQPWQPGNYPPVVRHGLAVYRDIYLEIGGFDGQFGYYGERPLAAKLHARGCLVGHAGRALLRHQYRSSLLELWPFAWDMVRGEYLCHRTYPSDFLRRYFGSPAEPVPPCRQHSRAVCRALGRELLRGMLAWRGRRSFQALVHGWCRYLPGALLGMTYHRAQRFMSLCCAAARCWYYYFNETRLRQAYQDLWQSMLRLARLDQPELPCRPLAFDPHEPCSLLIDDWPADRLFGFHGHESHDGRPFRWSEPVFAIRLPALPGPCELELETGGLWPENQSILAFCDDRRLPDLVMTADRGCIRWRIPPTARGAGHDRMVFFACSAIKPWKQGVPDRRVLGVPVFRIGIRPLGEQGEAASPLFPPRCRRQDHVQIGAHQPPAEGESHHPGTCWPRTDVSDLCLSGQEPTTAGGVELDGQQSAALQRGADPHSDSALGDVLRRCR